MREQISLQDFSKCQQNNLQEWHKPTGWVTVMNDDCIDKYGVYTHAPLISNIYKTFHSL